jgi:hypothetical protein
MSRRRARLRTALVGLCALLLSHWTLAAHACPVYVAAGQALAAAAAAAPAPDGAGARPSAGSHTGCADETGLESAVCVKHCASEEQATAQPPAMAAATVAGVLRIADLSPPPERPAAYWRVPARGHPPPLKLLYCVSLT